MKSKINILTLCALSAVLVLASCSTYDKKAPTSDSTAAVTVYTYAPGSDYNEDNDILVRLVANSRTSELYYIAEPAEDVDAYKASNGEDAYMDYVISKGTKADISKGDPEFVLTEMYGLYYITAVAVGANGNKASKTAQFFGLDWEDVADGTYYFSTLAKLGLESAPTTLQICTTDETLYRFKDLFSAGKHMKINLLPDYTATDSYGKYTFFRIPAQGTGLMYGNYGEISVRDIGYWQNNAAFVTDGGYESGMYADNSCFIFAQYYVSAGNLGYDYDEFVPNE